MTKTSIALINSRKTGDVRTENDLYVKPKGPQPNGEVSGQFDRKNGSFTMHIPHLGSIEIHGMPSEDSIGRGPDGRRGPSGEDGEAGTIKEKASKGIQGDRGAVGDVGMKGYRGYRGFQGDEGDEGDRGEQGSRGEEGHIPYYIQEADPGTVPPGTIWVKRVLDVKREAVDIAAPRLVLPDVTVYKDETRLVKVRISNNLETITRFEITPEEDDFIEIEYPIVLTDDDFGIELDDFAFRVTVKNPEIDAQPDILEHLNYTTTISIFVESSAGSDKQDLTLTVLPDLRN